MIRSCWTLFTLDHQNVIFFWLFFSHLNTHMFFKSNCQLLFQRKKTNCNQIKIKKIIFLYWKNFNCGRFLFIFCKKIKNAFKNASYKYKQTKNATFVWIFDSSSYYLTVFGQNFQPCVANHRHMRVSGYTVVLGITFLFSVKVYIRLDGIFQLNIQCAISILTIRISLCLYSMKIPIGASIYIVLSNVFVIAFLKFSIQIILQMEYCCVWIYFNENFCFCINKIGKMNTKEILWLACLCVILYQCNKRNTW